MQETLERAWGDAERLGTLKKNELQGWLFTALYHRFIDLCRRRKTEQMAAPELQAMGPGSAQSPEDRYLQSWASFTPERFREAVQALEPKERRCLELHLSGLKYKEIAALTGEPLGTVGYRINQAKEHLRELLLGAEGKKS